MGVCFNHLLSLVKVKTAREVDSELILLCLQARNPVAGNDLRRHIDNVTDQSRLQGKYF